MFTATNDKALLTTTTGALPRPSWYTANLRGLPLSQGFSQASYREQHFDCLACHVASQHRAGIDIFVDGDTRLDDDVAGRSWVSYATERTAGRDAAGAFHGRQGSGRPDVGGDRDPHDAAG
jgi:methionine synthase II (cobalamin-independent)